MNTNRRRVLHLAALSTTAWAWPGQSAATVTERSGSPDRKVAHKTFWRNTLSCDNAAVPVSQQVALHERGQADRHDGLPVVAAAEIPGQGRATSTTRPLSSLA